MEEAHPESVLRELHEAHDVSPPGITGNERPEELLLQAFPAFVGRQIRTA